MAIFGRPFAEAFSALRPVAAAALEKRLPAPEEPGLYFVGGGDGWLRQRTLRRIAAHHLGEPAAPYRLRRLNGKTASRDRFRSAVQTVAFSGGPVVVIETALRLAQPQGKGATAAFLEVVSEPPPRTVLAVEWEENPDRRRKEWVRLEGAIRAAVASGRALVVDCDAPPEGRMAAWTERAARDAGVRLPEGGAALLVERFGRDLRRQVGEIEKLALFAGDDGGISLEEMGRVLGGGTIRDRFAFTNALQAGRTGAALDALRRLLRDGESPQALMALLYRLVTQIQLAEAHRGPEPLSTVLGVPPRAADDLARAARRFRAADLRRILRRVAETDTRMKSTALPDQPALASLALLVGGGRRGERSARSGAR